MMVLMPVAAARDSMSTNSALCCSAVRLLREGQSMLATVAIQSPRISRCKTGGVLSPTGGSTTGGPLMPDSEHAPRINALAHKLHFPTWDNIDRSVRRPRLLALGFYRLGSTGTRSHG